MMKIRRVRLMGKRDGSVNGPKLDTLWQATLRVGTSTEEFIFREIDEFANAASTAERLVESSPSCRVTGAVIIKVERVGYLWN